MGVPEGMCLATPETLGAVDDDGGEDAAVGRVGIGAGGQRRRRVRAWKATAATSSEGGDSVIVWMSVHSPALCGSAAA